LSLHQLDDWVLCRIYNKKGVIERYDTVDDDDVKPPAPAKNNSAVMMKVEMSGYDAYYDSYETEEVPPSAEMLCFDRPFTHHQQSSADRGGSVPRLLHTTDNSSSGSEHVLSPSPDLPDRDHAESQPLLAAGWFDWAGGADVDGEGANNLFGGMPSPGGFTSARDAAAIAEMFAYLQRPF
jgi:hypothetical protein